jgi:hypothetical protein
MEIDGGAVYVLQSGVDVAISVVAPAARASVIFLAGEIGAGASEQGHNVLETVAPVEVRVDPRMVHQVFAVEHGGPVDFADSRFDFLRSSVEIPGDVWLFMHTHEELRGAQIRARVQIGGMTAWRIGVHGGGRDGRNQTDQANGKSSEFHKGKFLPRSLKTSGAKEGAVLNDF